MMNFFILTALALLVFQVPIKGSFWMLTLCTLLYVTATTGIGMMTSTFTSSQVAAVFVTAILTIVPTIQFSGLLQPVSTLQGNAGFVGVDLARFLLHARESGRVHEGSGAAAHARGRRIPLGMHPRVPRGERLRAPEAGTLAVTSLENILWLGLKELRSLLGDVVMVAFVVYAFTLAIYIQATGTSSEVNNASIAFVDEDGSALSKELFNAFYPPRFKLPEELGPEKAQHEMDAGHLMFVVVIPPRFEHDLRAGRNPAIQVNIDATAMQQASIGAGYIRNIIKDRVEILHRTDGGDSAREPINLVIRKRFNPNGRLLVVQERGGAHQSDHPPHRSAHRRRGDPRTGTRHARALARHAAHGVRDRDGQGVGQRLRDPRRDGGIAPPDRRGWR